MKKLYFLTLVCLAMMASFLPMAQAQTVWNGTADITWYDASQNTFDISTPEQLAGVAQLVNDGTANFSGKTLNLMNDLWLNSTGDSTNNWVPIGGYATATTEAQYSGNSFRGAFNGHGHSIYNLYCDKSNYFHAGLFGCIQNPCTIDSLVMINPVLKSKGMMGAIAGMTRSGGAIYIRYCLVVNGSLQGTGGNNIGFMVGANYPNSSGTQIQNCGATGTVSGNYPGGMGGNGQYTTWTNCYFAGTVTVTGGDTDCGNFTAHQGTLNNCYAYANITSTSEGRAATAKTQAEMQSPDIITLLGDAFKMDNGMNNGYPIMSYMAGVDPVETEICTGESVTLTAFGYDSYLWDNGSTSETITVSPTATTTYTVTGTSNGVATVLTSTVTVHPQAIITVTAMATPDGQVHGTVTPTNTTVACGSSDNVTITITPDANWHIAQITMNGEVLRGEDPNDGSVVSYTFNPGGTLAEVKVFFSNIWTITSTTVLDDGSPLNVSNLVTPWGTNGVYNATQGDSVVYQFNETSVYHITDVTIDEVSQGVISEYTFYDVAAPHTITVTYGACGPVQNFNVVQVMGTSALLSWNPASVGDVVDYTVEYKEATETTWTTISSLTTTQYMLSGLTPQTDYDVRVKTSCSNALEGGWQTKSFTTSCLVGGPVSIGTSTTTNAYLPIYNYYNYATSEQLFTSDELGGANTFTSISFNASTVNATTRTWDIYLMPTTLSSLPSSFVNVDTSAVKVFSGTVNISSGWFTINFDTAYAYDGTTNLILVMDDNTGSYVSPNYYQVSSNPHGNSLYYYNDYTNYDPYNISQAPSTNSYRNVVVFGALCDSTATCVAPNLMLGDVTENSAEIQWVPGYLENSWNLEYKAASDTEWISVGSVNGNMYELTGLNANTKYNVRMQSDCGSETSLWSGLSFRTECGPITELPYNEDFEDASALYSTSQDNYILCWNRYASDPTHYVYVPNNSNAHGGTHFLDFHHTPSCFNIAVMPALDASIALNTTQVHFYACKTGSTGTLEVGVMSDYNDPTTFEAVDTIDLSAFSTYTYAEEVVSFENYTGNGQYVAFRVSNAVSCGYYVDDVTLEEIPTCMYPSNLQILNVGDDNVTIAWMENGSATTWNVLYDTTGFNPENGGIILSVDTTEFTVTNLEGITTYDFYVQADCGGLASEWLGPVTATTGIFTMGTSGSDTLTTCNAIIYDNGGPNGNYSTYCDYTLVVYPATAGSGLQISGPCVLSNYSYANSTLTFYDGVGTNGTQLASYSNGTYEVAVASSNPITIHFSSSYYTASGFALTTICSNCPPPSNVTVTDIDTTSATISWSGNADSYAVVLNGPSTGYYTTNDTTLTISNLNSSSFYSVQIRSLCSGDSSLLTPAVSFSTACGAITITATQPWTEDFEGYNGGGAQAFICWSTPVTQVVDNGTSPFVYCGHSPSCHSGSNSAEMKGSNIMLALPEFTNDIHELRLSFWATTTNTSNYGNMQVGVITDINNPSSFEPLGPAGVPSSRNGVGNYMGPFDFNGVQATNGRIALRLTDGSSSLSWNLDDFTVELTPNCPSPVKTSVTATNVDGHNATITFVDNDPTHNAWTVYFKPSTDSIWQSTVTNDTTTTLTNLDPETTYDVYVVTNCATPDTEEDATMTIHFTTLVACPAPTNASASNVTTTEATISWTGTADSYNVEYGPAGFTPGAGTVTSTATTSIDLTGLTSGTAYTIYIQSDCGAEGTSSALTCNFSTAVCDVADQCSYTFTLLDSWGDGWNGGQLLVQQSGITVATLSLSSGNSSTETVLLCDNDSTSLVWNAGYYEYECSFTVASVDGTVIYTSPTMDNYTTYSFIPDCTLPTCPAPTDLIVSNVGNTSAMVSWTPVGTETSWIVEYKATTASNWTTTTATSQSITITGLSELTTYQVRVKADCGDETSQYITSSFMTPACAASDACPYTFVLVDGYGDGWNGGQMNVVQGGVTIITLEAVNHGLYSTTTYDTVVVSLCDNQSITLNWVSGSFDDEVSVYLYGPDGSLEMSQVNFENYTPYTFTGNCGGSSPATCDAPTGLAVNNPGQTSATATWSAGGTETSWNVQYKTTTASNWQSATSSTTSYTMTGLTAGTQYEIRVQAVCDASTTSDWTGIVSFTTANEDTPTCPAPTNLHAELGESHTTVILTWQQEANTANEWQVNYRQTTEDTWSAATANATSYTLTDLVPNVTYEFNVVAHCTNGLTSDPSNSVTIQTDNVGIQSWLENSVKLYPNPATQVVNVACEMGNEATAIEVYNVYGQLLTALTADGSTTFAINVADLANGMYYVRVTTNKGVVTKNFVKR